MTDLEMLTSRFCCGISGVIVLLLPHSKVWEYVAEYGSISRLVPQRGLLVALGCDLHWVLNLLKEPWFGLYTSSLLGFLLVINMPSFLRTPLKLSFSLLFQCFMSIKPCLISTICWIVGLMGFHIIGRCNQRNIDLPKWFIKQKKKMCLAGRTTHSKPKLSLLPKSQLCLFSSPETPRSVAPLCSPQRHLVTEPHTAGKRRIALGCLGKPCSSYFL